MNVYDETLEEITALEEELHELSVETNKLFSKRNELAREISIASSLLRHGDITDGEFYEKKNEFNSSAREMRDLSNAKKDLRRDIIEANKRAAVFHVSCQFFDQAKKALPRETFTEILRLADTTDEPSGMAIYTIGNRSLETV